MKYFKFNYILLILSIIFFAMIVWKFFGILSFADSSLNFEGKSKQEKIYPNAPIIQKITAKENGLNQINISVSKFSPKLGDKITLEVADESCKRVLAKSEINKFTWSSPNYDRFGFKSIADSKGNIYCLKLTYIPSGKEQDKKAYISSYPSEGISYTNTGKSIEEQKNRTLKLKPAYENDSTWQNFSQLIDRMSQYKPDFLKNYFLIFIIFLSIILSISLAIIISIK